VPYTVAIGLAVSTDGGRSFERLFEGPILDRTRVEPYFCSTPFVIVDRGTWKLWYAATTGFVEIDGKQEPQYQIRYAESADGIDWHRPPVTCIGYSFDGEANGKPCVLQEDGRYRMWYSFRSIAGYRTDRSRSYRIGYAESDDGIQWTRLDHLAGIDCSDSGWDSMMVEYAYVYLHRGKKYMLYVGNGFGETGFGYAILEDDDRQRS
jgi:hypothetical protein